MTLGGFKRYHTPMSSEPEKSPAAEPLPPEKALADDPLSPEQKEAFVQAAERAKKVQGAAKIAAFNGWTLVGIGGLSVLIGLFSFRGLLVGGALLALGWNELRGRTLLLKFDHEGARVLGWNQLALLGLIIFYCLDAIFRSLGAPAPEVTQLEELTGMAPGTVGRLTAMAYGAVILGTAIFQGLLSRYYFMREKPLREYLEETPPWIVELLRRMQPG